MTQARWILALATLGLTACADHHTSAEAASRTPVGTFKAFNFDTRPDLLSPNLQTKSTKEYLSIGANTVEVVKVCRRGRVKGIARVIVSAVISDRHFEIKTTRKNTVQVDHEPCTAEIAAGITAYVVEDNGLTLSNDRGTAFYGYRVPTPPLLNR